LAAELSDANRRALEYYREGAAVGWQGVETDDLVRRHAAMIGEIEKSIDRARDAVQGSFAVTLADHLKGSARGR
jgi:hypothetical protein